MITGININETKPYVSKIDPDKNNPTIFQIGVLDPFIRSHIDDQSTNFELSSKNPDDLARANVGLSKRNVLAVKFGLRGLENFADPQTKKAVSFDTVSVSINKANYNAVTDVILKMFSKTLIDELAKVILDENELSAAETKN
ncbi:MAG: hypothetical protein PHO42_06380 [Candidatus Omnitrophica bacterium]|nr:hypothetical protein [Candidatus Omnitrophota bacterium]